MTYYIPNSPLYKPKIAEIAENKFDIKKYKTHIWPDKFQYGAYGRTAYIKCLNCNMEIMVAYLWFKHKYYTNQQLTCDEYIIKNIIE